MSQNVAGRTPFAGFAGLTLHTLIGMTLLAQVCLRLWRTWASSDDLHDIALGSVALMIVGSWFLFFKYARYLDTLAGQVDEKILTRLCQGTSVIGLCGYLMLIEILLLLPHH